MGERLIIDNRTARPLVDLWPRLWAVLQEGKISNGGRQHCYATTWADGLVVASVLNEKSERLVIYEQGPQEG